MLRKRWRFERNGGAPFAEGRAHGGAINSVLKRELLVVDVDAENHRREPRLWTESEIKIQFDDN